MNDKLGFDSPINLDEWVYVRGIGVPKFQIDIYQQEIGNNCRLILGQNREESALLMFLDHCAYRIWLASDPTGRDRKHPPQRTIVLPGGERYVHRDLEFPKGMFGLPQKTVVYGKKKMWFSLPKVFTVR